MTPAVARSARRPATGRATAATPVASRARAGAAGRAAAPPLPRRLSGPLGGRAGTRAAPQPPATLGERALGVVRSLPDHSLIDRLVRGRAWIPVLGVLLAGLVTMQVEILKLGTSIGRSIERSTTLQGQNESLQAVVATLSDAQRIERLAAGMGMTMPSPSSIVFLPANAHNAVGRALGNIHAPDPANFAAQLAAQNAAAALIAPATTSGAPSTTTGATLTTTGAPATTSGATTTGGATPSTAATPGSSTSGGTATGPAPAATGTTSQPAATAPAAGPGDTAQAPQTSAPGAATAGSPTDSAPASGAAAATGAAGVAPASAPQSDSPPGG